MDLTVLLTLQQSCVEDVDADLWCLVESSSKERSKSTALPLQSCSTAYLSV